MFILTDTDRIEGRASVLGEFVKIDGSHVILRTAKGTVTILPKGFDAYKSKYLLVTGEIENNILVEEHVQQIEDGFDIALFNRLSKQVQLHPEIF